MVEEPLASRPTPIIGRRTGVIMAIAFVLANASNYTFQVIAGRSLTLDEYGVLGGFLAVITVITVTTSALQVMSARAIAAGEVVPSAKRVDGLTMSALKVGLTVGLVVVLLSPVLANVLRVGVLPVVLLALYIVPACLDSIAAGRLQGSRRFGGLAIYSTGQAAAKVTAAVLVLIAGARVVGLLAAVITGAAVVALLGLRTTAQAGSVQTHVLGSESRRSFAALALFWLILSIDVPLARVGFEGSDAGLYTAGAVLGKAVLWLPIVVTQVVFPSLADGNTDPKQAQRLVRNAGGVVVVLAVAAVGALYFFGPIVYRVLYGDRYEAAAEVAWKIGIAMIPLALVNLLMFQLLARRNGVFLKWFVMFAVVEIGLLLVIPQTGGWYAVTIGIVGTGLLVTVLLAARGTVIAEVTIEPAEASHPSDGLSLS
jgi:O-antigen/teichoic acid export membrane protein